jgi:hypothetical protein
MFTTKKFAVSLVGLIIIGALILSACGGSGSRAVSPLPPQSVAVPNQQSESGVVSYYGDANTDALASGKSEAPNQPSDVNQAADKRIVLKNATLTLIVDDTAATLKMISTLTEESGGWITASNSYQRTGRADNKLTFGSITIRVPAEKLNDALTQIKALAVRVDSENVTGQDVTQQYTDLSSQLTNLEAAEAQLRKIMDSSSKTDDVLAVYRELTSVRGQIEVIKGQIKYYDGAAAFSSIAVTLTPSDDATPLAIGGWQPSTTVKNALQTLVNALQGMVDLVIWLAIVGLPFAIPLIILFVLFRRRRSRRVTTTVESTPAEPPATA